MLLTTSRRTSQRTRNFCRELASVLPFCNYLIRGKKSVREIMDIGLRNAHERVVLVETREGNPFRLDSMDPSKGMEWSKHIYIGIKTRKDLGIAVTVPPLNEDVPIGVIGECDPVLKEIIMRIFNARDGIDSDVLIKLGKKDSVTLIDFIRKDVSSSPVGPQIRVKEYADDDPSQ